jgi:hypothetical protein
MPCGRPSAVRLWVRPVSANFVAQYAAALAQPRRPATEETLMIVPPPARRICGHTALASKNGAVKLTAMTRSQPCRSRASTGPGTSVAAAFTSRSTRRNLAATLATTASIAAASARSVGNARAVPPSSAIAVWVLIKSSALRASNATAAPSAANRCAVAWPRPLLAPVTTATWPDSGRADEVLTHGTVVPRQPSRPSVRDLKAAGQVSPEATALNGAGRAIAGGREP